MAGSDMDGPATDADKRRIVERIMTINMTHDYAGKNPAIVQRLVDESIAYRRSTEGISTNLREWHMCC